ncbi:MAG: LytR/AlgR family response regulator transcription factor, partial [Draconibacterium sp.]
MECLIINTAQCSEILWMDSIVYCCAEGSYTRVYLKGGRSVFSSKNLAWFERNLKSHFFVRMHRSYIINLRCIAKVFRHERKICLINGEEIPFSKGKSKHFWDSIG